jgi:hypothetical protein
MNEEGSRSDSATGIRQVALATGATALLTAGVVAVFVSDNELGSAIMLATGGALVVVAYVGDRLTRLSAGPVELELGRASAFEEAAIVAEVSGDSALAEELRDRALDSLRDLARTYEDVRREMPHGIARTRRMERLLRDARMQARVAPPEDQLVRDLFDGNDGDRVAALAAMYEHPRLRDFELLLDGIKNSRSAFEQFHALRLAEQVIPELDTEQRGRLTRALRAELSSEGGIGPLSQRAPLARTMLDALE